MIGMTRLRVGVTLLAFLWNRDARPVTFSRRLEESFGSLNANATACLLDCRQEMNLAAFRYLMLSPPVIITVLPAVLILALIKSRDAAFLNFFEPAFDRLDAAALAKAMDFQDIGSEGSWRSIAAALGTRLV